MTKAERELLSQKMKGYEAALNLLHSGLYQGQYVNELGLAVSTLHQELEAAKKLLAAEVERLQNVIKEKEEELDGSRSETVSATGARRASHKKN